MASLIVRVVEAHMIGACGGTGCLVCLHDRFADGHVQSRCRTSGAGPPLAESLLAAIGNAVDRLTTTPPAHMAESGSSHT
ncbi:hypothetical protein BIV25_14685 [Streptomyces sp. MUSC 14]|nr:hypothetical protein BIV25_14685 [Streptomyces sp. MUSC 14]